MRKNDWPIATFCRYDIVRVGHSTVLKLYVTLRKTNIGPENRPSQRKGSSSNHQYSGAKMLVSGRVSTITKHTLFPHDGYSIHTKISPKISVLCTSSRTTKTAGLPSAMADGELVHSNLVDWPQFLKLLRFFLKDFWCYIPQRGQENGTHFLGENKLHANSYGKFEGFPLY